MNMQISIIRNNKIWDLYASVYQNVIHIKHKKMSHESYESKTNTDLFKYHFNTHNLK